MAHQAAPNAAHSVASVSTSPRDPGPQLEYKESETVTLEWRVSGVNKLFDGSKGETKSRVVKSVLFGGGRWQILFYPNAGGTASDYCSLYLSCEPSDDEFEDAPSGSAGKWTRAGTFSFRFLIAASDGKTLCQKEASNHHFSSKTANWGWAQYGKREIVFNNSTVRSSDFFTIHCSISSSAVAPVPPPSAPHQLVPKALLASFGRLLNDQSYSDVEFFIAKKGTGGREGQSIWANQSLISRVEYFETMLKSGFAEDLDQGGIRDDESMTSILGPDLEDSDAEDDYEDSNGLDDGTDRDEDEEEENSSGASEDGEDGTSSMSGAGYPEEDGGGGRDEDDSTADMDEEGTPPAAKKLKLPRPSRRASDVASTSAAGKSSQTKTIREVAEKGGPKKTRIIVKDASYSTFFSLLFYLYTDTIAFAPLTSSFISPGASLSHSQSVTGSVQSATGSSFSPTLMNPAAASPSRARRAWISSWCRNHPNLPPPASAKSVYILADKMGLQELKQKAFDHIVAQLSISCIPYEVFSAFSAAFDEVRKCQVEFFLKNWTAIKQADVMRDLWTAIRSGRHTGFEDVWPLIMSQLEYKPQERDRDSKMGTD